MRVSIKGQYWNVYLLSDFEYEAEFGDIVSYDTKAVTRYNHKQSIRDIFISQSGFNKVTIMHELMHAYLSYTHIPSQTRKRTKSEICDDVEEIIVTKFERHLPRIVKLSQEIFTNLSPRRL